MLTKIITGSKKALSILLVFVMCFTAMVLCNPFEAKAIEPGDYKEGEYYYYPEGTTFISAINFSVDKSSGDASNALTGSGYTVLQNSNPNRTGNYNMNEKSNTTTTSYPFIFLGYKTTTDINSALGTALRAGINSEASALPDSISWSLMNAAGRYDSIPFKKVSGQDLNADVGGDYIYLYYHNPKEYSNVPAQGLPIVSLKGWTNSNSQGGGHGINGMSEVYANDTSTLADFDSNVNGAGYVYLFYDNSSVYTNVTSTVKTLISALDSAKGVQDQSNYTAESWNTYKAALDEANRIWNIYNNVYKAGYVKVADINKAVTNLNNAITGLKTTIRLDAVTNGGTTETTEYVVGCGLNTEVDFPAGLYKATREGHAFLGWHTDKDSVAGVNTNMKVPLGSTVYAIFSINKYSVYFANPMTSQTISTQTVEYGKDAVAPEMSEFTKKDVDTHYVFIGWDKDFTNIKSNITVNAQFEIKEHNYTRTKYVPATCTTKGTELYKCSDCGQEKTVTLNVDGTNHRNTTDYPAKASTCKEYGYTAYTYCEDCRTVVSGREILPLADCTWTDWVTTEPSCTVDGLKTRKCMVCSKTESEKIPSSGHEWGEWTTIKEATCDAAGRRQCTCGACNTTEVEIIPALSHEYKDTVVPPTCTEQGYTLHECIRTGCNNSYTDTYVEPNGHSWSDVGEPEKEATCTATGIQYQECDNCDATQNAVVPALGHDWKNAEIITEATCDTDGLMNASCDRCDEVRDNIKIPALGHLWDDGVVTKPATCTEDGIRHLSCTRENCNKTMDTVIKAAGHKWNDGVVTREPTCATSGEKLVTCTVCFAEQNEIIPTLNHKYTGVVTAPTCVDQGYTEYKCSECGDEIIDDYVPSKGHSYSITVVPPTCIKEGFTFARCTNCNHSEKNNFVDALSHDYRTSTVDPTCTEKGYDLHVCIRGDSEYKDNYVDERGHFTEMTTVAPTCTTGGYDLHQCVRCKYNYKENEVEELGHSYIEKGRVEPQGTQSGYILYGCESCTHEYKELIYKGNKALVCITIYDTNGRPVTEATITFTNVETDEVFVLYTDLNGYFTEVLPEGEYELLIQKAEYEDAYGYITVSGGEAEIDIPMVSPVACDCYCHQDNFWATIFRFFMKLRIFFGMEPNCCDDPNF